MGKRAGCGGGGERAGDKVKGRAAVPGSVLGDGRSQGSGGEALEPLKWPGAEERGHCPLRMEPGGWAAEAGRCPHLLVSVTLAVRLEGTCWGRVKVKVTQSCPTLCDPMCYIVHGILQARILEWGAFPFSSGFS